MSERTENTIKVIAAVRKTCNKKPNRNDNIRIRKETFIKLCELEKETKVPLPEIVDILICYGIEKMENFKYEEEK